MTDPQTPPPSSAYGALPPPPPPAARRGCLRVGLIGCGGVAVLVVVGIVAWLVWWNRNSDDITASAGAAARDGARFGLVRDEAACFDEARRRAAAAGTTLADNFAVGAFARACMEYSRPAAGFCDSVPPIASIRRTAEWVQQRCGTDGGCRNVSQVVQQYCAAGRPKRVAADTLLMRAGGAPAPTAAPPAGGAAKADSNTF